MYILLMFLGMLNAWQAMENVKAQVVLRAASGQSLLQADTPLTAATIDSYRPAPATVTQARKWLRAAGFSVSESGIGLSISGPQPLFERTFGTALEPDRHLGFFRAEKPLTVPPQWQLCIEAVVLPEPPELFR